MAAISSREKSRFSIDLSFRKRMLSTQNSINRAGHRRLNTRRVLSAMLLMAAASSVYLPALNYGFIDYDDYVHVVSNPLLDPHSSGWLAKIWRRPYRNVYIPVAYTFYAAETWFSRHRGEAPVTMNPRWFHAGNLGLHSLCAWLVFMIVLNLLRERSAAWFGALLFAWHPVQAESVAWVSGTPGLLGTMFSLLAIWQYLAYARPADCTAKAPACLARETRRKRFHYAVASVAFLLAVLAKPLAVAVPLIVALLDFGWLGRRWQSVARAALPWCVVSVLITVLTKWQQPDELVTTSVAFWLRPLVAADALSFYLAKLAMPIRLAPDYGRTPAEVLASGWGFVTWILPVGLVAAARWFRVPREVWTAAGVFVAALLPVLGLIPFGHQNISTVADRYQYAAMLGPALLAGLWMARHRTTGKVAGGIALLGGLALLSMAQSRVWRDSITLAQHTLRVNPASMVMRVAWAGALERRGQPRAAIEQFRLAVAALPHDALPYYYLGQALNRQRRFAEAEQPLERALKIMPRYVPARLALAQAFEGAGQPRRAIENYRQLVETQKKSVDARLQLAEALVRHGEMPAALEVYAELRELAPQDPRVLGSLSRAMWKSGDSRQALALARKVVRCAPESAAAWNALGAFQVQLGHVSESVASFEQSIQLDPRYAEALNNLAMVRRTQGRLDEARRLLERAAAADPRAANFQCNLGAVLIESGRLQEGEAHLRRAVAFDPRLLNARLLLAARLEAAGRPRQALDQLCAALALNPDNAELHNHVGVLLARLNRWNEAVGHFEKALDCDPQHAEAKANLARARRSLEATPPK